MIVVKTQFGHTPAKNAVEAAHLVADGGELCQIVGGSAIGWDGAQYADAPPSWAEAVSAVMATEGFRAERARMVAEASANDARREQSAASRDRANREYSRLDCAAKHYKARNDAAGLATIKAEYDAYRATNDGQSVAHSFMDAHFAPVSAEFVAVENDLIAAICGGATTAAAIAEKVGAVGEENLLAVQKKLAGMVYRKTLRQDRRGRFEVA